MATAFDPTLTEFTHLTQSTMIDIYKIGGGTIGRSYIGDWAYRVRQYGKVIHSGTDLHTGMPKNHQQVAELASQFHELEAA